jgi:peptide/nickel transport system ATP-binding protein
MIFQEPMSSLNPSLKWFSGTGNFVATHNLSRATKTETLSLFDKVKLLNPEILFDNPRDFRRAKQRVMIAMAIVLQNHNC